MNNTYQYNKVNCITPDRVVKKTDSKTLVKGYSTFIALKYNNSDPGNKGSHKTEKSHENFCPSKCIMEVTQGVKSSHGKLAQTLNDKPNKPLKSNTCSMEWDIKYKHIIALFFFFFLRMRIPWSSINHTLMRNYKEQINSLKSLMNT